MRPTGGRAAGLRPAHPLLPDQGSQDDQLGRKFEFLLQEIGREINTTGSKSIDVALTNLVLEAKSLVEQMKEQSANIC